MLQKDDRTTVRPEPTGRPDEEDTSASTDEVYIPDYVMIDFGVPETPHPKG